MTAQAESPKRSKRRILYGLLGALTMLGSLAIAGSIYQRVEERNDLTRYAPLGQRIDVGGFLLHIHCEGQGIPTVVVAAGYGDYSVSWIDIQSSVAAETRICLYDRAGFGWSDFDAQLPTKQRVAENLAHLLQNSEEHGPYVLVGHSFGGVLARQFAQSYPRQVAGMVLVDSSHENQWHRLPEGVWPELQAELDRPLAACRLGAPLGIVRLLGIWERALPTSLPEEIRAPRIAALNRRHYCAADTWARAGMRIDMRQLDPPGSLGDIPLMVLTRGAGEDGSGPPTDEDDLEWEETWLELQRELVAMSTNGEQRMVEAGHNVHLEQPGAVAEAIRETVMRTRARLAQ